MNLDNNQFKKTGNHFGAKSGQNQIFMCINNADF